MTVTELLKKHSVTMTEISKRYGIPYRTLQSWKLEERRTPEWAVLLLDIALNQKKEN